MQKIPCICRRDFALIQCCFMHSHKHFLPCPKIYSYMNFNRMEKKKHLTGVSNHSHFSGQHSYILYFLLFHHSQTTLLLNVIGAPSIKKRRFVEQASITNDYPPEITFYTQGHKTSHCIFSNTGVKSPILLIYLKINESVFYQKVVSLINCQTYDFRVML